MAEISLPIWFKRSVPSSFFLARDVVVVSLGVLNTIVTQSLWVDILPLQGQVIEIDGFLQPASSKRNPQYAVAQ